jgi:gentisate 1,2-dioxygenase
MKNTATANVLSSHEPQFFEYSQAADPVRPELTPPVPYHQFPASLYADGPTRVIPLDLSAELKCAGPATAPGLCANFVRVRSGESLTLAPNATSLVFYVIQGAGTADIGGERLSFGKGDFFTAPGATTTRLDAAGDTALYYVNDAPLLAYLGVQPTAPRFRPMLFDAARANAELARAADDPQARRRNRVSVLLGAPEFPLTRTVTHVLWAMYGTIGAGETQKPHRHQSIALDFIVACDPGCYTLVGRSLDAEGNIKSPNRVDWTAGCAFVTPPGYWHAHINESGREARLIPIQDAGLHTYLRSLDIRFS